VTESPNLMFISTPADTPITDAQGNVWRFNAGQQITANGVLDADTSACIQVAYVNQTVWRQRGDLRWQSKRFPGDPWLPAAGAAGSPMPDWPGRGVDEGERGMGQILAAIAALKADFDAFKAAGGGGGTTSLTPVLTAIAALKADVDAGAKVIGAQIETNQVLTTNQYNQVQAGLTSAVTTTAANQTVLTGSLDLLGGQMVDVIALLNQILAAVAGATSPAAAIATLQQDFTNLTQTLNSITLGISEKLQQILLLDDPAANTLMLAEIAEILAIVKGLEAPPPTEIALDFERATHSPQAVPTKPGP
jgi:hypothetical protein